MMERVEQRPYKLAVPNESNAARVALDAVFRPIQNSNSAWNYSEEYTAASQREGILRETRPYTEEELRMLEEADRFPPDLREQVRAFLEG